MTVTRRDLRMTTPILKKLGGPGKDVCTIKSAAKNTMKNGLCQATKKVESTGEMTRCGIRYTLLRKISISTRESRASAGEEKKGFGPGESPSK